MNITTRQLHPLFVGEVRGIDLREPVDASTVKAIVDASDRYAVLVFPDQTIDDEQQLAFSERLGPLETTIKKLRPGHKLRLNQRVSDLSNLDPDGRILLTARDTVEGRVVRGARGSNGFGYDPLFLIPALGQTAAELDAATKNRISHRGIALQRLLERLREEA